MPFDATVYKVMLASPGDLATIRSRVERAVNDWNGLHSEERGIVLLPILWEKHATPRLGGRPQELINEELVRPSDILIAVFNARLGQDTGKAESGTVEEIGEFLAAGKPVLLYFSSAAIPRRGFDASQYEKLEAYRAQVRQLGTYGEFSSAADLEKQLAGHLLNTMRRIRPLPANASPEASLISTRHSVAPASADELSGSPPADLLWRIVNESPAGQRRLKACLNLLGVGWATKGDRWIDANLRVRNEGEHEAWDVRLFVRPKGEDWRPGEAVREIASRKELQMAFRFRHREQGEPPIQERHEFDVRLEYRDGVRVDNELAYTVLFIGPGRDWRTSVHRHNTVVDALCPPQPKD